MSTEEAEKVQAIIAEGMAREGLQEMVLSADETAAKRLADFVSDSAIDKMIADAPRRRGRCGFRCRGTGSLISSRRSW